MRLLIHAEIEQKTLYEYEWRDALGVRYSFPCLSTGQLLPFVDNAMREKWQQCVSGELGLIAHGVVPYTYTQRITPIGLCECIRAAVKS